MNLIICCTPLQVLIAEKVMDLYPNEKFMGIFISNNVNEKHLLYYEKLNKKCSKSFWIEEKTSFSLNEFFSYWLKWKLKFCFYHFDKIFVANPEKFFIRLLVHSFPKTLLYTYDDGFRNILRKEKVNLFDTYRTHWGKRTEIKSILAKIVGLKYNGFLLKQRIKEHYTIYPNQLNIINNIKAVSLMDRLDNSSFFSENITIFIGQPAYELEENSDIKNKTTTQKIVDSYSISYYLPHPRENYKIDNIEYINTPLIFEDYFVQNLADKNVTIYTFFSTAALNVASLPNVKIISIKPKGIKNKSFLEAYDIFQEMGIEVIDYDDSRID